MRTTPHGPNRENSSRATGLSFQIASRDDPGNKRSAAVSPLITAPKAKKMLSAMRPRTYFADLRGAFFFGFAAALSRFSFARNCAILPISAYGIGSSNGN